MAGVEGERKRLIRSKCGKHSILRLQKPHNNASDELGQHMYLEFFMVERFEEVLGDELTESLL